MTQEHYDYLIELRDSGAINMWGATPFIAMRFGLDTETAGNILLEWMATFK